MDRCKQINVPFPNSYWVIPGKLLAGEYPGSKEPEEMDAKLKRLIGCGIRRYLNLMEENETDYADNLFIPYEKVLTKIAQSADIQLSCIRIPIRDFNIPSIEKMNSILDIIDQALDHSEPVYIHCLGGIGRTGTTVGCYLMRHGLANSDNVLGKIKNLRRNIPGASRSPETDQQREMIMNWRKDCKR